MIDHEYILFRGTSWNSKTIKIDSDEKWYSYVVFKYFFLHSFEWYFFTRAQKIMNSILYYKWLMFSYIQSNIVESWVYIYLSCRILYFLIKSSLQIF